jgi:predicted transglutaminase-like cysteine proteinase
LIILPRIFGEMIMRILHSLFIAGFVMAAGPIARKDAAVAAGINAQPFASRAFDTPYLASPVRPLAQWRRSLAALEKEAERVTRCRAATRCLDIGAKPLASLLSTLRQDDQRELVRQVNRHFNSFPYVGDRQAFRIDDHWLSPINFVQRSGDCEDFAIAKYFVLRLMGIPDERMQLLLVRDERRRLDHAVLLIDFDSEVLVLDNLSDVAPWQKFSHYRPIYAFNAQTTWHFTSADQSLKLAAE